MAITLKDVAKHANVSVSTVSRVLNNKESISEETIERVENAVKELMYKPSGTLTRLADASYTIALIIPDKNEFFNNDHTTSIDINSIVSEIERTGNKVIVTSLAGSDFLENIRKHQVDGVIICDSGEYFELRTLCQKLNIPVLDTNGVIYNSMQNYVDYDNYSGAYQAVDYLLSLGHENIGLISGPETHQVCKNRIEGAAKAFKKHKMTLSPKDIVYASFSFEGGMQGVASLLERNKAYTAFFCFSDFIAIGAMAQLKESGLKVPDDISIIGFDDMEISRVLSPALTTVARFRSEISALIVRSMLDLLSTPSIRKIQILLETTLVTRDSVKNLASGNEGSDQPVSKRTSKKTAK